jgi:hypothetical protein
MTKTELKTLAAAQVAQYPQYAGHFDGYVLVKVKKTVKTKMGLAFESGEVAIAKPTTETIEDGRYKGKQTMTVWSIRNKCDTSVFAADVEVIH